MRATEQRRAREAGRMVALAALAVAMLQGTAYAQQGPGSGPAQPGAKQDAGTGAEVTLDRVVAMVNGDLILESDREDEERLAAFQPLSGAPAVSREQLLNRLIDRKLIEQQMASQPEPPITDEVDDELAALRKSIPKCAAYHCETETGWEKFVADQGFTMQELRDRWRLRMDVLRFIEERFRMGIRISQAEIDEYYKTTLLPAYQKENAPAPAEATIEDRIQEILLQQQVDKLLDDWLAALRAQGSVTILKSGEEAP